MSTKSMDKKRLKFKSRSLTMRSTKRSQKPRSRSEVTSWSTLTYAHSFKPSWFWWCCPKWVLTVNTSKSFSSRLRSKFYLFVSSALQFCIYPWSTLRTITWTWWSSFAIIHTSSSHLRRLLPRVQCPSSSRSWLRSLTLWCCFVLKVR